jgi:hypothetical protein
MLSCAAASVMWARSYVVPDVWQCARHVTVNASLDLQIGYHVSSGNGGCRSRGGGRRSPTSIRRTRQSCVRGAGTGLTAVSARRTSTAASGTAGRCTRRATGGCCRGWRSARTPARRAAAGPPRSPGPFCWRPSRCCPACACGGVPVAGVRWPTWADARPVGTTFVRRRNGVPSAEGRAPPCDAMGVPAPDPASLLVIGRTQPYRRACNGDFNFFLASS